MSDTYTITPLTTPNEQPAILRDGQRMTIHEVCRELNRMSAELAPDPYTDKTLWYIAYLPNDPVRRSFFRIANGCVWCQLAKTGNPSDDHWVEWPHHTPQSFIDAELNGEFTRIDPSSTPIPQPPENL